MCLFQILLGCFEQALLVFRDIWILTGYDLNFLMVGLAVYGVKFEKLILENKDSTRSVQGLDL